MAHISREKKMVDACKKIHSPTHILGKKNHVPTPFNSNIPPIERALHVQDYCINSKVHPESTFIRTSSWVLCATTFTAFPANISQWYCKQFQFFFLESTVFHILNNRIMTGYKINKIERPEADLRASPRDASNSIPRLSADIPTCQDF